MMRAGTEAEANQAIAKAKWPSPRRMATKRTMDTVYTTTMGVEVAHCTVILKRGREVSRTWLVNPDFLTE